MRVAEDTGYAKDLVVSEARFERQLGNEIGRDVRRVIGERVITAAAAVTGTADQEVRRVPRDSQQGLRVLHRHAKPDFVVEVLGHANSVLPQITEAHVVLGVDNLRTKPGEGVEAGFKLRRQAPHLAARDGPAIVERSLAPELSLPQHVTVALIVGRGNADAQEVSFIVAGQNSLAPITLRQQRHARRASGTVEIRGVRLTRGRERDGIKLSAYVTEHRVRRQTVSAATKPPGVRVMPLK